MFKLIQYLKHNKFVFLFFLSLAIVGVVNFKSYGIAWQEPGLRYNAGISLIYIARLFIPNLLPSGIEKVPPLELNTIRDHGVALDIVYLVVENLLRITDTQQIYYLIHFLNFIVYFIGVFTIYCLVKRRLESKNLALIGALFFTLSPRIFADSNYLSADMGFTVFLLIATYSSLKYMASSSIKYAIFAGISAGFAIGIRIQGIIVILLTSLVFLINVLLTNQDLKQSLKTFSYYLTSSLASIYVFFPYLWTDPANRFYEVFSSLSIYNWGGSVLYAGKFISANDLPWHYPFVWILITTPIFYTILFIYGISSLTLNYKKDHRKSLKLIEDLMVSLMFFVPIFAVIFLNSVIYDGWRHLYFIYPYFIYFSTIGFSQLLKLKVKLGAVSISFRFFTAIFMIYIAMWMLIHNPMQNLYFNFLAGTNNVKNWEMDYLGLGNKRSLEYIVKNETKPIISIGVISFTPLDMSVRMLDPEFRSRFEFIEPSKKPDYLYNNFRGVKYSDYSEFLKDYRLFYSFDSQGSKYIEIWKLK